jgi:NAD/NADP transhydrogenase beta subunit
MFIAFSVSTLALAVGQVASSGTLTSRGNRQESSKHSPRESTSVEIHDLVETVFGIAMGTVAVWGIIAQFSTSQKSSEVEAGQLFPVRYKRVKY